MANPNVWRFTCSREAAVCWKPLFDLSELSTVAACDFLGSRRTLVAEVVRHAYFGMTVTVAKPMPPASELVDQVDGSESTIV